jgi:hypothetical protein
MLAIVKIERQGTGAVFRVNLVANCTPLERGRSSGSLILVAAQNPNRHCHNQPFLLLTTCLTARLGFNKFNGLASRQNAAREPLLARCDNAGLIAGRCGNVGETLPGRKQGLRRTDAPTKRAGTAARPGVGREVPGRGPRPPPANLPKPASPTRRATPPCTRTSVAHAGEEQTSDGKLGEYSRRQQKGCASKFVKASR